MPTSSRRSVVALLRTSPRTVLGDYHRLMNLAGYQDVDRQGRRHRAQGQHLLALLLPGRLDDALAARRRHPGDEADGYTPDLIHACHNRTVVIDAHLGERENKQIDVVEAHGLRNVHLYEGEDWIPIGDAVGDLTSSSSA